MAGIKVTDLPVLGASAPDDVMYIVDTSTNSSKQIAVSDFGVSGEWTPIPSDVTNDATVTLFGGIYSRTGNVVTAGFRWSIALDAAQLSTAFAVNLPIASAFTSPYDLVGSITGAFDDGVDTISNFTIRAGDGVLEVSGFDALINGGSFSGTLTFIYIVR